MDTPTFAFTQVFDGADKPLRATQIALPAALLPGQVLARVRLATICGSDLHTISGQRQEATPAILGHEAIGEVVAVGTGRRALAPGARISWTIADSCGHCLPCTTYGLPQKCDQLFKYGHAALEDGSGLNGCYASHIVLRAGTHIVRVPDALPDAVVAPANCALATMVNAVSHLPRQCQSVVIQGAGLLGVYACALLHQAGVPHVFCVDVQPARLAQIARFGGIPIDGRPAEYSTARKAILTAAPHGVDAALEVAGVSALVPEGIRLLRVGGHYGFVGMVHPHSQLELTGEQIIRKHLTIFGIHNYAPPHLDEAIAFLARTQHSYPYAELVSPPVPLAQLDQAISAAQGGQWHRVSVQPQRIGE
ncbi:MAG: zinc-binding dehydrogenase [Caldilineaceae bacterium]|nr:zinc-binding dehydrogenase [Caldilineaceae bacterium]